MADKNREVTKQLREGLKGIIFQEFVFSPVFPNGDNRMDEDKVDFGAGNKLLAELNRWCYIVLVAGGTYTGTLPHNILVGTSRMDRNPKSDFAEISHRLRTEIYRSGDFYISS